MVLGVLYNGAQFVWSSCETNFRNSFCNVPKSVHAILLHTKLLMYCKYSYWQLFLYYIFFLWPITRVQYSLWWFIFYLLHYSTVFLLVCFLIYVDGFLRAVENYKVTSTIHLCMYRRVWLD